MNKFFTLIGGRKFLLSIATIICGAAIDILGGGLSVPLAGLIGTVVTAFCASNWLNSREYHTAEAEKRKGGSVELAKIDKKLDRVVKVLDSQQDISYIGEALQTLIQSQASIMQSTDSTNKLIKAAMQPRA